MTVGELIAKLQTYPENLPVYVHEYDELEGVTWVNELLVSTTYVDKNDKSMIYSEDGMNHGDKYIAIA